MLKRIDRLFRDFILYILDLIKYLPLKLAQPAYSIRQEKDFRKEIFLIKTDEIGDYILFRNFLSYFKATKKFEDHKIILCGNIIWKNLAENLDSKNIDEFIWLNKNKFSRNLPYRFNTLKMLSSRRPEILVNCCCSRSFYIDDTIASVVPALRKIGFNTDLANSYRWQISLSNKYYSSIINSNSEVFDFYKNRDFFEKLLNTKIELDKPSINLIEESHSHDYNKDYVIFFTGGKRNYKKWKLDFYREIAEYIISKYNLDILLVGTVSETEGNNQLHIMIKNRDNVKDLSGKTSLIELAGLLKKAKLLITNDSGIVHLAASVNTKIIVILNGTQFGRFLPYPEKTELNFSVLFPPEITEYLSDPNSLNKRYKYRSILDINSVLPARVKNEVDKLIPG